MVAANTVHMRHGLAQWARISLTFTFLEFGGAMKKSIAMTLTLVAGAMMALAGCASVTERSAPDETAAMMLNYPWVAISNTTAFGNGPMDDVAAVTGHHDDMAAMMLNYPWVAISNTPAFGNGPLEDVAAVISHYSGNAFYAVPGQPSSDLAFATSQSYW
jgi:hypothetical protein